MKQLFPLLLAVLLGGAAQTAAQPVKTTPAGSKPAPEFLPGASLLFADDFADDRVGDMPAGWQLVQTGKGPSAQGGVKELGGSRALVLTRGLKGGFQPVLPAGKQLGGNFTVVYEYYQDPATCGAGCNTGISLEDEVSAGANEQQLIVLPDGKVSYFCRQYNRVSQQYEYGTFSGKYTGAFDSRIWHRAALTFNDGQIRFFLDGQLVLMAGGCYAPRNIWLNGSAVFGIRKVQVAANAPSSAPAETLRPPVTDVMPAGTIRFDEKQTAVKPEFMPYIRRLAQWLKEHPKARAQINGHADHEGTPGYNVQLSLQRAGAVKELLTTMGIAESRLEVRGYGTSIKADTSPMLIARARNRRVEVVNPDKPVKK
jgi:outer membrane protein OmpA-like peptidoglycan-associated protein